MNSCAGKRRFMCAGGTHGRVSRQHDRVPLTMVRGQYHEPTVVASGRCVPLLLERCDLSFIWVCPWIICSGPIGLVLLLS